MFTSTANLLLASAGVRGADILRKLLRSADSSLMLRFVKAETGLAEEWIKTAPQNYSSLKFLSASDLNSIYGENRIELLATQLNMDQNEIVRLMNSILYAGTRLVAPDGERISDRAAKRLDEELKSAILF